MTAQANTLQGELDKLGGSLERQVTEPLTEQERKQLCKLLNKMLKE